MADYARRIDAFRRLGARLCPVSVDRPHVSRAFQQEAGLPFDLLCDPEKRAVRTYDLLNPAEHGGIAEPATFVIDPTGVVRFRSLDNPLSRVTLEEVTDFLRTWAGDPGALGVGSRRKIDVPRLADLRQTLRNIAKRGGREDVRHFLLFPLEELRYARAKFL